MHWIGRALSLLLLLALSVSSYAQQSNTADSGRQATPAKKGYQPAEFPGGQDAWRQYFEKNLRYPKKAQRKNIQGLVRVQFMVAKDGSISEVAALNDPGGGLAEEAVRIILEGPRWIPAELNGKRVIYRHIQAITFKLE